MDRNTKDSKKIKDTRVKYSISLIDLERLTGYTVKELKKIEAGEYPITPKQAAGLFGTIEYIKILNDEDSKHREKASKEIRLERIKSHILADEVIKATRISREDFIAIENGGKVSDTLVQRVSKFIKQEAKRRKVENIRNPRITERRIAAGATIEEMAEALNISRYLLIDIEAGRITPSQFLTNNINFFLDQKQLGLFISTTRKEANVTLFELSNALNVHLEVLEDIENGKFGVGDAFILGFSNYIYSKIQEKEGEKNFINLEGMPKNKKDLLLMLANCNIGSCYPNKLIISYTEGKKEV